jgi:hypothetical protein
MNKQFLKVGGVLSVISVLLFSCSCGDNGGNTGGAEVEVHYKNHTTAEVVSPVEQALRGDTVKVDPSYDLYFDFSSTMKRAVSDKVYSDLITSAIFESDDQTSCYIIGANPELKKVTGDNTVRKNTFLDALKYSEKFTYLTANINNAVANPSRPSLMFTDFSIDENKPTVDINGIRSSFIRGPEFKSQFAQWFSSGGTIRIYGKRSMVDGQNMPIYVIAFLPKGMDKGHKVNNILSSLDSKLKDIYFDFHPRYVSVEAVPNDKKKSDYLGWSMQQGGVDLKNGMGEILVYDGQSMLTKVKKDAKAAAVSFFDGLSFKVDSSSYLTTPEFSLQIDEFTAKDKKSLSDKLSAAPSFFKEISTTPEGKFQVPLVTATAKLDKYYQDPRFFRIAIMSKAGKLNLDDAAASRDLIYNLKSGGKPLANNCLYESISKGLDEAVRNNKAQTIYTICAFIKGPSSAK